MIVRTCPNCMSGSIIKNVEFFVCNDCGLVVPKAFLKTEVTDIMAQKNALVMAVRALKIIAENGGKQSDSGLNCNGSWCAEQASVALRNAGIR